MSVSERPLTYAETRAARAVIAAALDQPRPTPELRAALDLWLRPTATAPIAWWHPTVQRVAPGPLRVQVALATARAPRTIAEIAGTAGVPEKETRRYLTDLHRAGTVRPLGTMRERRYEFVQGQQVSTPSLKVLAVRHMLAHGPTTAIELGKAYGRHYDNFWRVLRNLEALGVARHDGSYWMLVDERAEAA